MTLENTPYPRFQVPDFNDPGKWANRIVNNLLYYQTNYFLSAIVIFLLITFLNPGEMILGIITMALSKVWLLKID